ncbi:hypothetical protein, partial [Blautia sp.]|uniref:hypothetical protein n=1 Tax=Blautia sp. TaxID=1955243 RepID=UPI003AB3C2F8
QFFIITAAGQEFAVSPLFDDLALIDDEEKIGVTNGRQAMGDDDALFKVAIIYMCICVLMFLARY